MPHGRRMAVVAALACGLVVATVFPALTSSHREAPLTAADPQIDNTDVYAFVSPDAPNTVTIISNWIPFQEPAGGPNFYFFAPGTRYVIYVDNDGDALPDITFRWTFTSSYKNPNTFLYNTGPVTSLGDATLNFTQTYKLEMVDDEGRTRTLLSGAPVAPSFVGEASMPDYATLRRQAVASLGGGGKSFAGQADDPFFLDLRVFDLLYGADLSEVGNDTLAGYNVNVIAIQVPKTMLLDDNGTPDPVIGIWSTAERPSMRVSSSAGTLSLSGPLVQVSRLGNPLVNEVVVPVGLKDRWNASQPRNDSQFAGAVLDPELPKLIQAIYGIPAPKPPRNDLVAVFLTGVDGLNKPRKVTPSEMLRLNTSIMPSSDPNRLGVLAGDTAGYPNGRRLADDVLDIALQAVEGILLGADVGSLGDGVDRNDVAFARSFPYVAMPHSGSAVTGVRGTRFASAPAGGGAPVVPLAAGMAGAMLALATVSRRRRIRA